MKAQEIADVILEQINCLDPAALSAYGAQFFNVLPEQKRGRNYFLGGIAFKVRGLQFKGLVEILLCANDTYYIFYEKSHYQEEVHFPELIENLDYIEWGHTGRREYSSADILKSLLDDDED